MTAFQEALHRAAATRARSVPDSRIFVEDRVHTRVSAAPGRPASTSSIRFVGVALDGTSSAHVTDPPISALERLDAATWTVHGPPGRADDLLSAVLPEPELPASNWVDVVSRLSREGIATDIVAFHQNIWVANGEMVQEDTRKGGRIELRSGDDPRVILDLVLGPRGVPEAEDLGGMLRAHSRARLRALPLDPSTEPGQLVFAPGVGGILAHELVGHALEGDAAAAGSRLARAGVGIAPRKVRIVDDPTRGRAAWKTDDEGVAPRAVTLIEEGRVAGRLLDRFWARRLGACSTGHGRRGGYLDRVLPRMGCTFMEAGSDPPAGILHETRRGVYVRRMIAGHADPESGRATFIVTDADRIESGDLKQPLLPFVIELDAVEALSSIDLVGNDLAFDTCIGSCVREGQPLAVSVGAPTVRLGVITVIH